MKDVIVTNNAFERWSQEIKIRFIKDFSSAYNAEKGTDYQIMPTSLQDVEDYDFTLTNSAGALLKAQHTFAAADPEDEYVGPKLQAAIIAKLQSDLKYIENIHISIGFKKIQNKSEASILVEEIKKVVNNVVGSEKPLPSIESQTLFHYGWTDAPKPTVSQIIVNFLTELSIYSFHGQIVFTYGGQPIAMMTNDTRADQAIRKKEMHYSNPSDIILLVHYNSPLFRDFFEPIIKENHAGSPFGGIWLFDAWKNKFIFIK